MNIHDRVAELDQLIRADYDKARAAVIAYRAKPDIEGPSTGAFAKAMGMASAERVKPWMAEKAALQAPIVSMIVHEGRVLVATHSGVFEIKGDTIKLLEFDFSGPK